MRHYELPRRRATEGIMRVPRNQWKRDLWLAIGLALCAFAFAVFARGL